MLRQCDRSDLSDPAREHGAGTLLENADSSQRSDDGKQHVVRARPYISRQTRRVAFVEPNVGVGIEDSPGQLRGPYVDRPFSVTRVSVVSICKPVEVGL